MMTEIATEGGAERDKIDLVMHKVLNQKFFDRPTVTVAKELLGKYLVRKRGGKTIALMITEVEAYDGPRDKASHASRGMTPRTKIMFGPAGRWFVYFTYGMHWMLNVVTGKERYPAAVLIRGIEGVNGPGRVTKFLHVDKKLNGKLANRKNDLWIEERRTNPVRNSPSQGRSGARRAGVISNGIKKSPRIGVQYAGAHWARKNYRFFLP